MAEHIDVFISSTSKDLTKYRSRVKEIVERAGAFPIAMEEFDATERNALQKCYDELQKAEVFIGIYAHRYGFIPDSSMTYSTIAQEKRAGDGKTSITHHEYLWALEKGLPMLLYLVSETDEDDKPLEWPIIYVDGEPEKSYLADFKRMMADKHVVDFFYSPDRLASRVATGLTKVLNTLNQQSDSIGKSVPFQAISPPSVFVGREDDFQRIKGIIQDETACVVIRGGIGGLGKTAFAAYTVHELREYFSDGILWARLDTTDTMSILASFVSAFGEKHVALLKHLTTIDARSSYYRSIIADKRCLIVLDNAENPQQVIPLLPSGGASKILVTTRYSIVKMIPNAVDFPIEVLSARGARDLLLNLLDREQDDQIQELDRLCAELGYLPLAIHIAADILRELDWTIADYLKRIKASTSLDWLSDESLSESVRASFAISYDNLPNDAAKKTFRLLGIFPRTEFSIQAVASILGMASDVAERILLILKRRGLVNLDEGLLGVFNLHPLIHRYATELLTKFDDVSAIHRATGEYFKSQISPWNPELDKFSYSEILTNNDTQNGIDAIFHYFQAGDYADAQDVLVAIADGLGLQGRMGELFDWIEKLNTKTALVPWLVFYRGDQLVLNRGEHDFDEGLQLLEKLLLEADPKVVSAACIALAEIHFRQENFDKARSYLSRSLELKRRIQPVDSKGIAYIINEMARILLRSAGTPQQVLELHMKALDIQKQASDIKGMSYTLRKMSSLYLYHFHDHSQAADLIAESERFALEAGDRIGLISILSDRAELLRVERRYVEAVELLKQAQKLSVECNEPVSEAFVLKRLSLVYEAVELFGEASNYAEDARSIFDRVETRQAARLEKILARLTNKKDELTAELNLLETRLAQLESSEATSMDTHIKSELRVARRRRKRIRQQLGLEAGLIRLK